jgi:hypothetical protein
MNGVKTIQISARVHQRLKDHKKRTGIGIQFFVEWLVNRYLDGELFDVRSLQEREVPWIRRDAAPVEVE